MDATGTPFCTTIGAKSILSENHPLFHGVYNGKASLPEVRRMFKEVAHCRIGLGAWTTSKNLAATWPGGGLDQAAHEGCHRRFALSSPKCSSATCGALREPSGKDRTNTGPRPAKDT